MTEERRRGALYLGIGLSRSAAPKDLLALVRSALGAAGLDATRVAGMATLDRRGDHPALVALADKFGTPIQRFSVERLQKEAPRLQTPSPAVEALVGTAGVAEAAALAAGGPDARLVIPKTKGPGATVAVAEAMFQAASAPDDARPAPTGNRIR